MMLRRQFFRSLIALAGLLPGGGIARPVQTRAILLQTSPVAGFQYHAGETLWPLLHEGQALDLVREPHNPYDKKAIRVDWNGSKLGYVPRLENHAVAQLLDRGEKLSARIVALKNSRNPWKRARFEVLLQG